MAQPATSQEFTAFYLQRTTQEFAEDLDKVREADDFKAESLPFLIHALQQGTALYSTADQARVARAVAPAALAAAKEEDQDVAMDEPQAENENRNSKKEKKEKSKRKKSSG
ncbi:hypothetical protein CkaCkLH20_12077 [Colletotrichum karsti]|uniref:Ribosome assembly protein 3 n=1 Tax=Colletotrichum karsti TaxID=1095194 RepID=A0A9P6HUQ5_9PEZI|nr:uncharacterized protein CkaCkLH20_12077 [Colletotrichum karsti]KAF9870410.1 hypothetical protein CkaCkLH20_12077 [Colletotrichum karsti]